MIMISWIDLDHFIFSFGACMCFRGGKLRTIRGYGSRGRSKIGLFTAKSTGLVAHGCGI